jgi:hypothetical protein
MSRDPLKKSPIALDALDDELIERTAQACYRPATRRSPHDQLRQQ